MDTTNSAPEPPPLPCPAHHYHLFLFPHHHPHQHQHQHQHHHHHHQVIICHHHHNHPYPHHHHHNHPYPHHHHCPRFNASREVHTPPPLQNHLRSATNPCHQPFLSSTPTLLEPEHSRLKEEEEEEEEDEPVFVLTDEWRDFFAKSEARRKLEKQQAKRKGRK